MVSLNISKQRLLALAGAAALTLSVAGPAMAADSKVTTSVTAGTRTASIADVVLGAVDYAHADTTKTGTLTLTADDSTGSNTTWSVTVHSSDFIYSGSNGGADIPAANFSLTDVSDPSVIAGQDIDATGGPKTVDKTGGLDGTLTLLSADAGFGKGTYKQTLSVSLVVPADSAAGTYTGTVTTSITAAP